jgi:hypothetical protein
MKSQYILLGTVLLFATTGSYGQTRRSKRPVSKPQAKQQKEQRPALEDIGNGFLGVKRGTMTFAYSAEGRNYYIYEVAYNAELDALIFSYVVQFDQQTPAGRSALNTARYLAETFPVYPDQLSYITSMQYMCSVDRQHNTVSCYELLWTDEKGNTIAKCPSSSSTQKEGLHFIDILLRDSHVNPEGKALVLRLGEDAKRLWDKIRQAK